jgi:hypothetical protein
MTGNKFAPPHLDAGIDDDERAIGTYARGVQACPFCPGSVL